MKLALDSSVLVGALSEDEQMHVSCQKLSTGKSLVAWTHVIAETFSSLTGGRESWRASPAAASRLIDKMILPRLRFTELSSDEIGLALRQAHSVGARGGAVYDYLHLVAARKAGAAAFYTLNLRHFIAVARRGDPEILLTEV